MSNLTNELAQTQDNEQRTAILESLDKAELKTFAENEFIPVNKRLGHKKLIAELVNTIAARFNQIDAGEDIYIPGLMGLPTMIDTPLIKARKDFNNANKSATPAVIEIAPGKFQEIECIEIEDDEQEINEEPLTEAGLADLTNLWKNGGLLNTGKSRRTRKAKSTRKPFRLKEDPNAVYFYNNPPEPEQPEQNKTDAEELDDEDRIEKEKIARLESAISPHVEILKDIKDFDQIIAVFHKMTDEEFEFFARSERIDINHAMCRHDRETQNEIAAKELIKRFDLITAGKFFVKSGNTYSFQDFYTEGKSDDMILSQGIITPIMEAQYNKLGFNDFVMKAKIMYWGVLIQADIKKIGKIKENFTFTWDLAGMIKMLKNAADFALENKSNFDPDFIRTIEYVKKNYNDDPEPTPPTTPKTPAHVKKSITKKYESDEDASESAKLAIKDLAKVDTPEEMRAILNKLTHRAIEKVALTEDIHFSRPQAWKRPKSNLIDGIIYTITERNKRIDAGENLIIMHGVKLTPLVTARYVRNNNSEFVKKINLSYIRAMGMACGLDPHRSFEILLEIYEIDAPYFDEEYYSDISGDNSHPEQDIPEDHEPDGTTAPQNNKPIIIINIPIQKELAQTDTTEQRIRILQNLSIETLYKLAEKEFIKIDKRLSKEKLIIKIAEEIEWRFEEADEGKEIYIGLNNNSIAQIDSPLINYRKEYINVKNNISVPRPEAAPAQEAEKVTQPEPEHKKFSFVIGRKYEVTNHSHYSFTTSVYRVVSRTAKTVKLAYISERTGKEEEPRTYKIFINPGYQWDTEYVKINGRKLTARNEEYTTQPAQVTAPTTKQEAKPVKTAKPATPKTRKINKDLQVMQEIINEIDALTPDEIISDQDKLNILCEDLCAVLSGMKKAQILEFATQRKISLLSLQYAKKRTIKDIAGYICKKLAMLKTIEAQQALTPKSNKPVEPQISHVAHTSEPSKGNHTPTCMFGGQVILILEGDNYLFDFESEAA